MMANNRVPFRPGPFTVACLLVSLSCSLLLAAGIIGRDPDLEYFAGNGVAESAVSIAGEQFLINGIPTYSGTVWNGTSIEGLLLNSRMVLGTYDDLDGNPPSGMQPWDARWNTADFIGEMPAWSARGLNAITINFQGGSNKCHGLSGDGQIQSVRNNPYGASGTVAFDDWRNNRDTGHARYLARIGSVIRAADDLGMVVILGLFYFGQDEGLRDEAAVIAAVDAATDWILHNGWRNVVVEINNEADLHYDHTVLQPSRIHELMQRVKARSSTSAGAHLPHKRLLVSSSLRGGGIPSDRWITNSDFVLLHGNGRTASGIGDMIEQVRARSAWRVKRKPIVFNEDSTNTDNFRAALEHYASWGFYDDRGYQCAYPNTTTDRWMIEKTTNPRYWSLLSEVTRSALGTSTASVESLTLIDADRDAPVEEYDPIPAGATLNLAMLPTRKLNIRANTLPATIESVRFTLDGQLVRTEVTAPYTLAGDSAGDYAAWTPSVGSHVIIASPANGGSALSLPFVVVDQPNAPPTVTLTSPSPSQGFSAPATLGLAATATDDTGTVRSVAFLVNGATVGEDTSSPYAFTWQQVPAGIYALQARATDSGGMSATSPPVTISVSGASLTGGTAVVSFTLIDADTNLPVPGWDRIVDGAILDLATLPTRRLNIRANTQPATVGSVAFDLDGFLTRIESVGPYAFAGDLDGDYHPWTPSSGSYTLSATPFSGESATGVPGAGVRIQLTVR